MERQSGITPAELQNILALPEYAEYLWEWFCELSRARGGNGFSITPISYLEIKAWSELSGITPTAWEVDTIKAIDAEFLKVMSSNTKR